MQKKPAAVITPCRKKPTVETPEDLTNVATLEDYEKAAANLAASSDRVIDKVLDRIEKREEKVLKRQEKNESAEKAPADESKQDAAEPESPNPDGPEREEAPQCQPSTGIQDLLEENARLKDEISRMSAEFETRKVVDISGKFREEIKALTDRNDDLLLRNSELEFEISRLKMENNSLKQKLEQLENSRKLPPQTYSKESYTRPRQTSRMQVSVQPGRGPFQNPKMGMNGYESWN